MLSIPNSVTERALTKRVPEGHCLVSTYSTSGGYGQISWQERGQDGRWHTRKTYVHRVVWLHYRGDIPKGLVIDHICRNRRCSRLSHLRLLTNSANLSRNAWRLRTHCPRGHEYGPRFTEGARKGWRHCKICARESRLRKAA